MYAQICNLPTEITPDSIDETSADFVNIVDGDTSAVYAVDWNDRYSPDALVAAIKAGEQSGYYVAYTPESVTPEWIAEMKELSDEHSSGAWDREMIFKVTQ